MKSDCWEIRQFCRKLILRIQDVRINVAIANMIEGPSGAEGLARELYGSNAMSAQCAAYLMLEIMEGAVQPQATEYMSQLLIHHR